MEGNVRCKGNTTRENMFDSYFSPSVQGRRQNKNDTQEDTHEYGDRESLLS